MFLFFFFTHTHTHEHTLIHNPEIPPPEIGSILGREHDIHGVRRPEPRIQQTAQDRERGPDRAPEEQRPEQREELEAQQVDDEHGDDLLPEPQAAETR